MAVFQRDLVNELVVFLESSPVDIASLLLQLTSARVNVIFDRHQRLDGNELHPGRVLLALVPANPESFEQHADALEHLLKSFLFLNGAAIVSQGGWSPNGRLQRLENGEDLLY